MEFPPELIHYIRDYTKPAFIHWKIYKRVKEQLEVRHWTSIRKALQGQHSMEVEQSSKAYLKSVDHRKFCEDRLRSFDLSVGINRHLQCWCQEAQMLLQLCDRTQEMVSVPVLTEEQDASKRRCESSLLQAKIKEVGDLYELLFVVYGQEYVESDSDEYCYSE